MDFDQLKYFVSVVQLRNFTAAAKKHHISQPAISRRITDLESNLGCRLLIRDSHSVQLTDAGREFYEYAVSVLSQTDITCQRLDNISHGRIGRISISTVPTSAHIIRQVIAEFHKRYPMIQIDVDYFHGKDQITSIGCNDYDFYFSVKDLLDAQDNLTTLVTDVDEYHLYVPSVYAHLVNENDLSRLNELPLLCESRAYAPFLVNHIIDILGKRGYDTSNMLNYNSFSAVIDFANAGFGFTVFPQSVSRSICTDYLVDFPLHGEDIKSTNAVGWNPASLNDTSVKFSRLCQEMFA